MWNKVANMHLFWSSCIILRSALLHAGHQVSRSHACPGSLKTNASRQEIHDIFRSWIKEHPVRMDKIPEKSPARQLLAKEPQLVYVLMTVFVVNSLCRTTANFERHPGVASLSSGVKLVRYQENPSNWGPGTKAASGKPQKRKRSEE
jgi:tRNA (guanine26-N2/guanine27-N2)-dimethyltransferase